MEFIFHSCALCSYKTKRKYDLKRHENAMHNKRNQENIIVKIIALIVKIIAMITNVLNVLKYCHQNIICKNI